MAPQQILDVKGKGIEFLVIIPSCITQIANSFYSHWNFWFPEVEKMITMSIAKQESMPQPDVSTKHKKRSVCEQQSVYLPFSSTLFYTAKNQLDKQPPSTTQQRRDKVRSKLWELSPLENKFQIPHFHKMSLFIPWTLYMENILIKYLVQLR
jgi:hypothetical protein